MAVRADVLNKLFVDKLNSPEGQEKTAAVSANYVRDFLRENSFSRKIQPPETVTNKDCQRSVNHDGLVKIIDM